MRRIPVYLLKQMQSVLTGHVQEEMAIPSYLHPNPVMRWMAWRRVELLADHLRRMYSCKKNPAWTQSSILDFGCGSGVMLGEASQCAERVYGSDVFIDAALMLVNEWDLENVTIIPSQDLITTLSQESLDVIIAGEVLEHINDIRQTLLFFRTRLKLTGRLLVSLPTEGMLYRFGRRLAGFHGHYHLADAKLIHNQILSSGFKLESLNKTPGPGAFAIYWIVEYSLG